MFPQFEGSKAPSWWALLKALSYEGGPSSTRFVFLATFATMALSVLAIVFGFVYVYVCDPQHPASAGILAVLSLMLATITGFAANSHNVQNQLRAQQITPRPLATSSTPATAETENP